MTPRPRITTAGQYPSPLLPSSLDPSVALAFGVSPDLDTITRREAMRVPSVRRGRAIIAGTIGALSWQVRRGAELVDSPLVAHPNPDVTPQFMYTWLVDDLLFNGIAWWRVLAREARADGRRGFPVAAERVARERVSVDWRQDWRNPDEPPRGVVHIDGREVDDADVIRFDGPDEGVLAYGAEAIVTYRMLSGAVRKFAKLDVPLGYLTPEEGAAEISTRPGTFDPANPADTRSEADALLDEWELARATRTTAFLNRALKYQTVMFDASRIELAAARQEQNAELSRLMNLPPRYVNAPQASGMTYATTEGDRRDLLDTTLQQYITAIGQRLSMPDVTPRGQRVNPDVWTWLRGDTKTVLDAGKVAIDARVMDADEVRTDWLGLPARTQPAAPAPITGEN